MPTELVDDHNSSYDSMNIHTVRTLKLIMIFLHKIKFGECCVKIS